jgi:phosphopantothenoylcysteine decarboxylase / phosphopantothenate---cysteine ligase
MGLGAKKILLAVSGGIAAYKAAELCRRLEREGAEVRVMMTPAATKFITPLTFQALTRAPVATELLSLEEESTIGHITLARWAALILVAPATADFIARVNAGICDDVPSTVICAGTQPVLLCPAMNVEMWKNPIVQRNLRQLGELGRYFVVPPGEGDLACREVGAGRLAEPEAILARAGEILGQDPG